MCQHQINIYRLQYLRNGKKLESLSDKIDISICYPFFSQFTVNSIEVRLCVQIFAKQNIAKHYQF